MKTIFLFLFPFLIFPQSELLLLMDDNAFSPSDISGLILHLDASVTSSLTLAITNVTTWADQSGLGNNATQSDADRKPIYNATGLNSKPTVNFQFGLTGTADILALPDFASALTSGEIFLVLKAEADPSGGGSQGCLMNIEGSGAGCYYPFVDGNAYVSFLSSDRKTTGDPTLDLTTAHILNIRSATNSWTMDINETEHYTTGTNTVAATATPFLGGYAVSNTFDGYISEVIMFNRVLTAPERLQIKTYLKAKWSLVY